jgi:hypothetical protein
MEISITPQQAALFEKSKASGLASSPAEWLDQLIEAWQEQSAQEKLGRLLQEGEESGQSNQDFNALFDELRMRYWL